MKKQPIKESDRRRRPYVVSLDWLSLRCSKTLWFKTDGTNAAGYTLVDEMKHGSRNWRQIRTVYDQEGTQIATLTFDPCNCHVDPDMVVVKAENSLLYEEDGIDRFLAAITGLGLQMKAIARVDLACDFNEFFNGLLPQSFFNKLWNREFIKVGLNKAYGVIDFGYHASVNERSGELEVFNRIPDFLRSNGQVKSEELYIEERNKDIEGSGLQPLTKEDLRQLQRLTGTAQISALTWGRTGRAIQVQIYNKTKELREVKMKKWIVDTWKAAGLDLSRDVWRVECRIQLQGKQLVNCETGEKVELSTADLLTPEQVHELFKVYAEKYFCFYHNDGHIKIQNAPRVQLFSWCEPPVARPKRTSKGSPTKYIQGLANKIISIGNEAKQNNDKEVADAADVIAGVFARAYGMQRQLDIEIALQEFHTGVSRQLTMPMRQEALLSDGSSRSASIIQRALEKAKQLKHKLAAAPPPDSGEVDWNALEAFVKSNIIRMVEPMEYHIESPT